VPKRYRFTVPPGDSVALLGTLQHMLCTLADVGPELTRRQREWLQMDFGLAALVLDQYAAVARSVRAYAGAQVFDLTAIRAARSRSIGEPAPLPDDPQQTVMFDAHTMSGRLYGSGT
jgi:hypothetical protein